MWILISLTWKKICNRIRDFKFEFYHCTPLVWWIFHKYKCLWGVGDKGQGSSFQEQTSHTYIFRLGYSRISILYHFFLKVQTLPTYTI